MQLNKLDFLKKTEPAIWRFWPQLTEKEKNQLLKQLSSFDLSNLKKQKQLLKSSVLTPSSFEAFDDFSKPDSLEDKKQGEHLIQQGSLGCLVLAGGQGSRLRFFQTKGCYPISLIKKKSLFQLIAEKVKAASQKSKRPLLLAIMTSPENNLEVQNFFSFHHLFGLSASQLFFFSQQTFPLLNNKGQLFLDSPFHVAEGPNGNGYALHQFINSKVAFEWKEKGVAYLQVIPIDNPLADPFDAELLGFHVRQQAEMTMKCTEKTEAEEKVGVVVKKQGICQIIEYSELSSEENQARNSKGQLKHRCANLGLFCFSLDFVFEKVKNHCSLPLHASWKSAYLLNSSQQTVLSSFPSAWKFETFVFDWLILASKIAVLLCPREKCFAPLKNASGANSPETVRQALLQKEQRLLEEITGCPAPLFPIELAAEFYYPDKDLYFKWWKKQATASYVEP